MKSISLMVAFSNVHFTQIPYHCIYFLRKPNMFCVKNKHSGEHSINPRTMAKNTTTKKLFSISLFSKQLTLKKKAAMHLGEVTIKKMFFKKKDN